MDIIIQINSKSILDTEKGIWKRMYCVEMWVMGMCAISICISDIRNFGSVR
jgi:selenophosphate synthetase-related protein